MEYCPELIDASEQLVYPWPADNNHHYHQQYQEQSMHPKAPAIGQFVPQTGFSSMSDHGLLEDNMLQEDHHHLNHSAYGYDNYISSQKALTPCPELDGCQRGNSPAFSTSDGCSTVGNDESSTHISYTYVSSPTISRLDLHNGHTYLYASQSPIDAVGGGCQSPINLKDIQYVEDITADENDHRGADVGLKVEMEREEVDVKIRSDAEDSGVAGIPDAESTHQQSDADDDPRPTIRTTRSSKRSGSDNNSNHSSSARVRKSTERNRAPPKDTAARAAVTKKTRRPANCSKKPASRPFPCPLAVYGCTSTFTSKNEWKRHVSTQHIKLSYWRCDLCPNSVTNGSIYYNDFNRKDLFTQHLRRMHLNETDGGDIAQDQDRCSQFLRHAPSKSGCLFCEKSFEGKGSWDDCMEHIAIHMQKDGSLVKDFAQWRKEPLLEKYLRDEGLIKFKDQRWCVGSGTRSIEDDADADDVHDTTDMDADGEDDDHDDNN